VGIGKRAVLGIAMVGYLLAIYLPLYTPEKPQIMIYRLVQNGDLNQAWLEFVSLNALPRGIEAQEPFDHEAVIYPWTNEVDSVAVTEPLDGPPPDEKCAASPREYG